MDGFVSRRSALITLLALLAVHAAHAILGIPEQDPSCYEHLDSCPMSPCFPPYLSLTGISSPLKPECAKKINTTFYVQTREDPEQNQTLDPYNTSSINDTNFSTTRLTVLVIHGFTQTCFGGWVYEMCKAILLRTDCNCVAVSWVNGSGNIFTYLQSASNTRVVGAVIAFLIKQIMKDIDPSYGPCNYSLIGHSLGAQVAAEAGKRLTPRPCAIVGLDPAKPLFQGTSPDAQLDKTDAHKVTAIHTDTTSFGVKGPTGHCDFYPNGGKIMPGCLEKFGNIKIDILNLTVTFTDISDAAFCNHRRSYEYFLESILNCRGFLAFSCKNYESFLSGSCFPRNTSASCKYMGFCEVVPCNCINRTVEPQPFFLKTGNMTSHLSSFMYNVTLYTRTSQLSANFSATINIDNNKVTFNKIISGAPQSMITNVESEIVNMSSVAFMWNTMTERSEVQVGAVNVAVQSGEGQTINFCGTGTVKQKMKQELITC